MINGQHWTGGEVQTLRGGREFILGPVQLDSLRITRKIQIFLTPACARYLEIIENTGDAPVQFNVAISSNLGGGTGQTATPPSKDGKISYAAVGQSPNRSSLGHRFGTDRSRQRATFQDHESSVTVTFDPPIKLQPRQRVCLLHVVAQRRTLLAAEEFAQKLKLESFVRDLDPADRRCLANIRLEGVLYAMGNLELFRGETGDAVKLKTGELLSGTLQNKTLTLAGEFGEKAIPAQDLLCCFGILDGAFRMVLSNGEILTGKLQEPALQLKLRGGSELSIPLAQVAKYGRRVPAPAPAAAKKDEGGEGALPQDTEAGGEQFVFSEPIFMLRGGDRLIGKLLQPKLTVRTLYGELSIGVEALRKIVFPSPDQRIPLFELANGSLFSGLLADSKLDVRTMDGKTVRLDPGRLEALYFQPEEEMGMTPKKADPAVPAPKIDAAPRGEPRLKLVNGDFLKGTLQGESGVLPLETPFGVQRVGAAQIKRLRLRPGTARGVRVTLWDGATLPGVLPKDDLAFRTFSGTVLAIPIQMVVAYSAPLALPPAKELEEVEQMIAKLGDPEPAARDAAHRELSRQGTSIQGVLVKNWKHADLETRNRVRMIFGRAREEAGVAEAEADAEESLDDLDADFSAAGLGTPPKPHGLGKARAPRDGDRVQAIKVPPEVINELEVGE